MGMDIFTFLASYTDEKGLNVPGHITHERTGIITAPVIAAASLYYTNNTAITGILTITYLFSTYYLSPDLDHDVGAASYRRWGWLRFIWYPYKQLVKHRSWISHSGPISATIKLLYLLAWSIPLWYILPPEYLHYQIIYAIVWMAVSLADTVHCLMDLLWKDK